MVRTVFAAVILAGAPALAQTQSASAPLIVTATAEVLRRFADGGYRSRVGSNVESIVQPDELRTIRAIATPCSDV